MPCKVFFGHFASTFLFPLFFLGWLQLLLQECVTCSAVHSPFAASQVAEDMPPPKKKKAKQKQKLKGGKRKKLSVPGRKKSSAPIFEPPGMH